MKNKLINIFLILILLTGLSLLLYPSISNFVNSKTQSKAVAAYNDSANKMEQEDYTEFFTKAEEYNTAMFETENSFYAPELVEGYFDCLNMDNSGIMGYISIDKIKVELPIYHTTSVDVLNVACGHLEGTSLPVGGENTHCVLSAHRGLPRAKLFTDLDQLEVGDTFELNIIDRSFCYVVDSIQIVEPDDIDALKIVPGKDYCTLFTCTPYGINSHRLLVRGERYFPEEEKPLIYVPADGHIIDPMIVTPIVAAPILLIMLIWLLFSPKKKSRR